MCNGRASAVVMTERIMSRTGPQISQCAHGFLSLPIMIHVQNIGIVLADITRFRFERLPQSILVGNCIVGFVVASKFGLLPLRSLSRGVLVSNGVVRCIIVTKVALLPLRPLSKGVLVGNWVLDFIVVSEVALFRLYALSQRILVGRWIILSVVLRHPLTPWIVKR